MLPFGSITSIIPLFVLALAYLLYIGTSIISKNKAENPFEGSLKKEIFSKPHSKANQSEIHYADLLSDIIIQDEGPVKPLAVSFIIFAEEIPDKKPFHIFCGFCFSVRPPPFS